MNDTRFYVHDSDSRIAVKKDRAEVRNWTDDLEYVNEELEYLLNLEDLMLNNREMYQQLHTIRRENMLKLGFLYRYDASMQNAMECDTTECDAFYLHKHEKNRDLYSDHIKKYRNIKNRILFKILVQVKT